MERVRVSPRIERPSYVNKHRRYSRCGLINNNEREHAGLLPVIARPMTGSAYDLNLDFVVNCILCQRRSYQSFSSPGEVLAIFLPGSFPQYVVSYWNRYLTDDNRVINDDRRRWGNENYKIVEEEEPGRDKERSKPSRDILMAEKNQGERYYWYKYILLLLRGGIFISYTRGIFAEAAGSQKGGRRTCLSARGWKLSKQAKHAKTDDDRECRTDV